MYFPTMNPAKCNQKHYINFLVATQKSYSYLEAEKTQARADKQPFAHEALNRLLLNGNHSHRCCGTKHSFFLTNINPQIPALNRGMWRLLEERIRKWALKA